MAVEKKKRQVDEWAEAGSEVVAAGVAKVAPGLARTGREEED